MTSQPTQTKLAWEKKKRQEDRIAEKRMKILSAVVFLILLTSVVYALAHHRKQPGVVEKGPTAACRWNADQIRY
jgi:hypothetical protein